MEKQNLESATTDEDDVTKGPTKDSNTDATNENIKPKLTAQLVDCVVLSDDEVEIFDIKKGDAKNLVAPTYNVQLQQEDEEGKDEDIIIKEGKSDEKEDVEVFITETKPGELSPREHTCSICLSEFDNKSFLDQCFHAFCFYCILQWSEVVRSCPLCKASFLSIIHSVKSMTEFEQHHLPEPETHKAPNNQDERRFRYRSTVIDGRDRERRRQHATNAWEQRAHRRQLYLSTRKHKVVMAKEKRRAIYANNMWVQCVTQSGKPKFRDITPGFFRANPACVHRLILWLSRELLVLLNDEQNHVDFTMKLIMTLMTKVEMDSDEFAGQLQPFLSENTHHFIHELISFARSPFEMTAYDERAQYNWPQVKLNQYPETPTVLLGNTTSWDTPDVAGPSGLSGSLSQPGPSGLAGSTTTLVSTSATPWDDDTPVNYHHGNANWSPALVAESHDQATLLTNTQVIEVGDGSPPRESVEIQEIDVEFSSTSAGNDVQLSEVAEVHVVSESLPRQRQKNKHKHKHKHVHKHTHRHRYGPCGGEHASEPGPSHLTMTSTSGTCSKKYSSSPESRLRSKSRGLRSNARSKSRSRSPRASRSRSRTATHSPTSLTRSSSRSSVSRSRTVTLSPRRSRSRSLSSSRSKPRDSRKPGSAERTSRTLPRSPHSPSVDSRSRSSRSRSRKSRLDMAQSRLSPGRSQGSYVSVEEEGSRSVVRPLSPTEEDMKKEIEELETRIAADKQRLLQLLVKQEKRRQANGEIETDLRSERAEIEEESTLAVVLSGELSNRNLKKD